MQLIKYFFNRLFYWYFNFVFFSLNRNLYYPVCCFLNTERKNRHLALASFGKGPKSTLGTTEKRGESVNADQAIDLGGWHAGVLFGTARGGKLVRIIGLSSAFITYPLPVLLPSRLNITSTVRRLASCSVWS
jgi:hypothetical protein